MVKTSTASRAFIKLDDGVATASSIYHTGSGNFEFMSVSLEVALTATKIEASIEIASGSAITVTADGAMLVEGNTPVGFSPNFADIVLVPRNVTSQSSTSRGNVAYADLDAMSIANVIVDGAQSVEVSCTIAAANDAADSKSGFQVVRGSTRVPYDFAFGHTFAAADDTNGSKTEVVTINIIDIKPAAGNYTYKIQWAAISGGTVYAFQRSMSVRILPEGVSA
jgi:hypothetical protein